MPILKHIDKEFFKEWSASMAYVLGFMFADGNIIKNSRGAHFFSIYSADYDLLLNMRKSLKSNHKISKRKSLSGNNFCIQIGSREMFYDLINLGLTPNKTTRMNLPKIPQKYFRDFVRGYFDGDGSVWSGLIHKERKTSHLAIRVVFTSCSGVFLDSLKSELSELFTENGVISKGLGNYYRLTYSIRGALKLYEIMYNNLQSTLFLQRKKKIFEKYIKTRNMRA